ncbi:MAG: recombinase family protein [Bacteroidetes bacterium]|nr:recombinase family protein [Bacteroidota bacterium]
MTLAEKGALKSLSVLSIDRVGRDIRDLMNTIYYFNEKKIPIKFLSQGLTTLDGAGKENPISKMIISILGIVAEMERNQIRERQLEGIKLAKLRGVYRGRSEGSKENVLKFLSKGKNKKALLYLKKGYKANEAARLAGIHINTVTKIKKLGMKIA